jgi:hypothetical protein
MNRFIKAIAFRAGNNHNVFISIPGTLILLLANIKRQWQSKYLPCLETYWKDERLHRQVIGRLNNGHEGKKYNQASSLLCQRTAAFALFLLSWSACAQQNAAVMASREAVEWASPGQWQVYTNNPVIPLGSPGSWDTGALGTMTVVRVGGLYHLYYEAWGVRGSNDKDYYTLQIGHAVSSDGVHWTKDPANPVLPKGAGNDWDCNGTWDPSVIYEDGLFKMWHGGGVGTNCDWGYATSTDGIHFVKRGQLSHLGQVEDDHVVHDRASGRYFMCYWNRQYEPEGLYCAQSPNETNFDFAGAQPIHITGLPYTNTMYKFPNVFQENGQWFMYFGKFVRPGCLGCGTGYATSKDGLHWQVQNPRVMLCHDAFVLRMADNLYFMYYGPDGYFDQKGCDIRLAVYKGKLNALARKPGK